MTITRRFAIRLVAGLSVVALLVGCATAVTPASPPSTESPVSVVTGSESLTTGTGSTDVEPTYAGPSQTGSSGSDPTTTSPYASPPTLHPTTSTSESTPSVPHSLTDLNGRSFTLVGLFTDAGGADTMTGDASFVLTFDGSSAHATTQCGRLEYPVIAQTEPLMAGLTIDFGTPQGPDCRFGTDPAGPPSGRLSFGLDASTGLYWLSTGFVAWKFRELMTVDPCPPMVTC